MARIIRGPSVKIGDTDYPLPDVLDEIKQCMAEDAEDPDDANIGLIEAYYFQDAAGRKLIDATLTWVCGFSLPTVLAAAVADEDLIKALTADPPPEATRD